MTDILGPASAPNAVSVRPGDGRIFGPNNTWFADCSSPTAEDGTMIQAAWLNGIMAQLRDVIETSGVTQDNLDDMLRRAIIALSPGQITGTMIFWPASTPPTGWLKRNGAAISRTTYSALFAVIGTTYGVGDGSTTFNLPDDRSNFERGWDDGRGIDTGRVFGSEQLDELESHTHRTQIAQGISTGVYAAFIGGQYGTLDVPTTATGGSETRPRNRAYLPIIKF